MRIRTEWATATTPVGALAVAVMVLMAHAAWTAGSTARAHVELGPGSTLWLEGKSNLHEFESRTREVAVAFTRDSSAHEPEDVAHLEALVRSSGIRGLDLQVPVTSLRSEKSGIDKNLWRDLRAVEYPQIQFHLIRYTVVPPAAKSDTIHIRAEGALSIAGRERPTTLTAVIYRGDRGLWLDGSQMLRMTDFGVTPRKMMMGALRVKDDITIRYHLLLVPAGAPALPAASAR